MKKAIGGRIMRTAAAGALSISLLAGCGGNDAAGQSEGQSADSKNADSQSTGSQSESTAQGNESEGKTYHYTMAMYNIGPWNEPVEALEYYKELFPDMDMELVYVERASATEKISLMVGSKETPDVIQMADKNTLYNQGALGGWSEEFFREHAPNISKIIDETDPTAWNYAKYDGENMYTIPGWNWNYVYPEVSVWNQDWLDAVGEEVPTTLEDAERVFYKFVNEDPDQNGQKDTYAFSSEGFKPIYGAYGFERGMWLDDGDGNLVYADVMPEAKDALAKLNQYYKDGLIDPEFITGEAEGGYWALSQPLNKQKIGYTCAGLWYHWQPVTERDPGGRNIQEFMALNPDGRLSYGVPLVGPKGKSGHAARETIALRTVFSKELVEDTERFARLLEFIDYVNGSDMAGDMNPVITSYLGKENENWKWNDDGSVGMLLSDDKTLDDVELDGWRGTFTFMEEGGSLEFQRLMAEASAPVAWIDEVTADYPECYKDRLFKTLETAGEYKAELNKLVNEGYIAIITGEQPLDYFDEMVDLWYSNGGQEMTDEANEWYKQQK